MYLIKKMGEDFFVKLIKTHKGSKYLQKMLSNNKLKEYEVNYVTEIICKNFFSIFCDYYGNYFLQKFFKFCTNKNRLDIYKLKQIISNGDESSRKERIKNYIENFERDKEIIETRAKKYFQEAKERNQRIANDLNKKAEKIK